MLTWIHSVKLMKGSWPSLDTKRSSEAPEVILIEAARSPAARAGGAATCPECDMPCPFQAHRGPDDQYASGFPGETVWMADSTLGLTDIMQGRGEGLTMMLLLLVLQ